MGGEDAGDLDYGLGILYQYQIKLDGQGSGDLCFGQGSGDLGFGSGIGGIEDNGVGPQDYEQEEDTQENVEELLYPACFQGVISYSFFSNVVLNAAIS
ncbi:MAG: hypothetical protein EZS28_039314 [Streblomastix strix]|uniref:Uncharacterized protein n=1 Tax=Streblomastix strix TaxID=222440 RepID=A0A5J4U484_9EUKA|nr:MAG: hypothetical protein EZS28_039314 [Streblomastix strix]